MSFANAIKLVAILSLSAVSSTSRADRDTTALAGPSPFLIVFAGDTDESDEDFIAIVDLRPDSSSAGDIVATMPIGTKASMPHHFEYELPPPGRLLFANSHYHEETLLLDVSDPLRVAVRGRLRPPSPLRFPHDYFRLPNGNVLAGFLRSDGPSPRSDDRTSPGGHGGIAEYDSLGRLLRTASAAAPTSEPVRPYALMALLDRDRIVTTSAAMMEESAADVVQIWRYSDLGLLHTIAVPPGRNPDGTVAPTAARAPFALRALSNGAVLVSTYGCSLNLLTGVESENPKIRSVYTFAAAEPTEPRDYRGACAVPLLLDEKFWLMPVGREETLITLDVANPNRPHEVSRLDFPEGFAPHWLAQDPRSRRLVLGAHEGGQEGLFILTVDPITGRVTYDDSLRASRGRAGYIDLSSRRWPHGATGAGWAHAALFLSHASIVD